MKKEPTLKQVEKMILEAYNREMRDDHLTDRERLRLVRLAAKHKLVDRTNDLTSDYFYIIF